MEENNQIPKKNKNQVILKSVAGIAACAIIALGGGNIYATTQGYDNVFFMIKYFISGENITVTNKSEILSDRDITISYEPIKITEKIAMQIKNLQIKDNQAKLVMVINENEIENNEEIIPLQYKVYNSSDEILCTQTSIKAQDYNNSFYTEELKLTNFKEADKILKVEIYKSNSKLITKVKIDLENRTLEVEGENEALEKISEIELKKFFGYIPLIYDVNGNMMNDDWKITSAVIVSNYLGYNLETNELEVFQDQYGKRTTYGYKVDEINLILDSVFGMKVEELQENDDNQFSLYEKNGVKYFATTYEGGMPVPAECIDVTSISYCGGLYTATYTYCELGDFVTIFDVDINDYNIYEHTVTFELNEVDEKKAISKFRLVSSENPVIIKNAEEKEEGTTDNDNNTNVESGTNSDTNNNDTTLGTEKIDNYASTMSWNEYWAPGIKIKYPTIFDIDEVGGFTRGSNQGEISTIINGIATGIDPDTKEIVKSNLNIDIYEPIYIENFDESSIKDRSSLTNNKGMTWYLYKTTDGDNTVEEYVYYSDNWEYRITFSWDKTSNYKVRNIINWMLGSTETGSY